MLKVSNLGKTVNKLSKHDDASIAYCQAHGITYQSYQIMDGCPFGDSDLAALATKYGKSCHLIPPSGMTCHGLRGARFPPGGRKCHRN